MKIATVTELRNHFRRVSSWIENGEAVQIIRRGKAFAHLVPVADSIPTPINVNFAIQRKAIWGEQIFSKTEIKSMDQFERDGEEV